MSEAKESIVGSYLPVEEEKSECCPSKLEAQRLDLRKQRTGTTVPVEE